MNIARLARGGLIATAAVLCLAAGRSHEVPVKDLAFGPDPADVRVGDTVRWVNRDILRHSATAAGAFDVDLEPGVSAGVVFRRPGLYNYVCRYHPGMKGRIRVAP